MSDKCKCYRPVSLFLQAVVFSLCSLLAVGNASASTNREAAAQSRPLLEKVAFWWQKKTQPHAQYERQLRAVDKKSKATISTAAQQWLEASQQSLKTPYSLSVAHAELGEFSKNEIRADGYSVAVKKGQRLSVELIAAEDFSGQLFVDLFKPLEEGVSTYRAGTVRKQSSQKFFALESKVLPNRRQRRVLLEHLPKQDGRWLIRLQPSLQASGKYEFRVSVTATLGFPVKNVGNSAARSFFGADRDAGRRRHHGVDIFAARNTPVLAVADGTVVQVGRSPRGGLHLWLRDAEGFAAYYYAHLETVSVGRGQRVKRGDSLGGVGNSGNARTTAPHLHFGIYRGGPIDPWPYIRKVDASQPSNVPQGPNMVGHQVAFTSSGSARLRLRSGPGTRFTIRDQLNSGSQAQVLAATENWLKLRTDQGLVGWASARYLEPVI